MFKKIIVDEANDKEMRGLKSDAKVRVADPEIVPASFQSW